MQKSVMREVLRPFQRPRFVMQQRAAAHWNHLLAEQSDRPLRHRFGLAIADGEPRRQLTDDSAILDFLLANVGWFDMYVDDYAAYVRYCFEDPLDAEIFRGRFERKAERYKLAG
jgi:hypothetical protein